MKKFFAAVSAFVVSLAAMAQATIRVDVHNIVELSERFNVVFVVEGEHVPSEFGWECCEDFTLVWGPQKGSSTSISMVGGKMTRSSQTSYTYILQPKRAGTFTLPPATAKVKGTQIQSRSAQVQVVDNGAKGGASASQAAPSASQGGSGNAPAASGEDIFMRLVLSKNRVVVGEPLTATLKIYNKANLTGFENAKFPSFNGFWSTETLSPSNIEFQREQLGGTIYNAAVLRRWTLIPQKAGDLVIDPSEIVCLVNVRRQRARTGSIFDDFFENDYMTVRSRVTTPSQTVHVTALPSGAPASFGGGVGHFTVKASLDKDSLRTHDAASLQLTVSGKGNVSLLSAPKVVFPPDFEVYDVKTHAGVDKSGITGSKTFEYPFIPRSPGNFKIAPIQYGYYDIDTHRYQVATTDTLYVSVFRSAASTEVASGGERLVVERKGVKNLGEDIRFIHTRTTLAPEGRFLVSRPLYWGLVGGLLALATGLWLSLRKLARRRADVSGTRKRKATRQALGRLRQAGVFLKKNSYAAFYEELHRALLGFVADKLGMDLAEQTKENIAASLLGRGVGEDVTTRFTALLDACEFARYAPDAGHDAMNAHYEEALRVITAIDASMKKTSSSAPGAVLALLLLLLPATRALAATSPSDSLFAAGVLAYTEGDYPRAAAEWEAVLQSGVCSKDLLYNLGNAYFKSEDLPRAILFYERSLRLDPSDKDVRNNLAFAREMTQDRIEEVPEFILKTWGRKCCFSLPGDIWAVLSLILFALTLGLVLLFLLGSTEGSRRTGFFTAIATLLLTLLCWGFAQWQKNESRRHDSAIVMRPVTSVNSAPGGDAAKTLFILHEGTKVKLLDQVSGFSLVSLSDGRQGWIPETDIERI